jgi:hypothetical protein
MPTPWLADTVLFVHVLFVLFVVGGFMLIAAAEHVMILPDRFPETTPR